MTLAEFSKQPRGPYLIERWIWQRRVSTDLGAFAVGLDMAVGDLNPPDNEMLKRASELTAYIEEHGEYVLDIVFGHYLLCAAEDPEWLEGCGVPPDLKREGVLEFVREDRGLSVSRHLDSSEPYSSEICVVPLWDEEHALRMDFRDGAIVALNESKFRLESGVVRWIDD